MASSRSMPSLCWVEMSTVRSADGLAVDVVEGDLGLAVGAQVGDGAGLAHLGQALGQAVGDVDRQRHEHVGLVAGVAEHHPLVAGALLVELVLAGGAGADLLGVVDALGDVGRLLVEADHDAAGVAVVAVGLAVVADLVDRLADDLGDVDVGRGGDLAGDDGQAGGDAASRRPPGSWGPAPAWRRGWRRRSGRPSCRDGPR